MFEKDLPGGKSSGFNAEEEVGNLPLETAETINHAWGFNINDRNYKSSRDLIRYLVRAAGDNANFLLNVGPMPNGKIQPEFVIRLREMGEWLSGNGESIYGTRGGPILPHPWGVKTQKADKIYVHILDWPDPVLLLPPLPRPVKAAHFLKEGRSPVYSETADGVDVKIPEAERDEVDTIIVLELSDK